MHENAPFLNDEQIARLFRFCREHDVPFYDVQVELVDHLAEAIEQRPELPFEDALQQVYNGFGRGGFETIMKTKKKEMARFYLRSNWHLFISYFTWPKALGTLCWLVLLYTVQFYFPLIVLKCIMGAGVVLLMGGEFFLLKIRFRSVSRPVTPLLLLSHIRPLGFISPILVNVYFNVFRGFRWLDGDRPFTTFSYSAFVFAFVIMMALVLAGYDLKKKMYALAHDKYPGAFEPAEAAY
jgi:hypothetical protein